MTTSHCGKFARLVGKAATPDIVYLAAGREKKKKARRHLPAAVISAWRGFSHFIFCNFALPLAFCRVKMKWEKHQPDNGEMGMRKMLAKEYESAVRPNAAWRGFSHLIFCNFALLLALFWVKIRWEKRQHDMGEREMGETREKKHKSAVQGHRGKWFSRVNLCNNRHSGAGDGLMPHAVTDRASNGRSPLPISGCLAVLSPLFRRWHQLSIGGLGSEKTGLFSAFANGRFFSVFGIMPRGCSKKKTFPSSAFLSPVS